MNSNCFAIVLLAIVALATGINAFSMRPMASSTAKIEATILSMTTSNVDVDVNVDEKQEEMVTMRCLNFVVDTKPLGIVLEELGDGVGVYVVECDLDGAAYAAGLRDGDVLASLQGDEAILNSSLDGAMALMGQAPTPLSIRVYRELEESDAVANSPMGGGGGVVKMSPRRLPSTKKLLKASTNANFWKDPLMIGSAVLTIAMPLGIFVASSGGKGL